MKYLNTQMEMADLLDPGVEEAELLLQEDTRLSNKKDGNPKDLVGGTKVPYDRLPFPVLAEVSVALHEGARKYGAANWRSEGVQSGIYISAAMRHLSSWQEGEDTDPDSGLSHISKAIAGLMVLRDGIIADNWVDTRPRGCVGFLSELNKKVVDINERYPDAVPPFLACGQDPRVYNG